MKFYILNLSILLVMGCSNQKIKRIEVYSLPISMSTRTNTTEDAIISMGTSKKYVLTDHKVLEEIKNEISKLEISLNKYERQDIRVLCRVKWSRMEEKIVVNNMGEFLINENLYKSSPRLLELLRAEQ